MEVEKGNTKIIHRSKSIVGTIYNNRVLLHYGSVVFNV